MRLPLLAVLLAMAATPALADPPAHAGRGKQKGGSASAPSLNIAISFGAAERAIVRDYYGVAAHCPPGLAKKNNGCLPPGQAKKWARGQMLPRGLVYHDLPRDLTVRLPLPPAGQKYVRIAADILLIAVGTGLVLDAIEDLGRL
jgi:Ni/Co efflux regulator RcnB